LSEGWFWRLESDVEINRDASGRIYVSWEDEGLLWELFEWTAKYASMPLPSTG
jgi:hypothetical protein